MENISYPTIIDMEKMINSISGVMSSKIVYDEQNEIEEIHIISNNNRSPKQVSRDIQSVLAAQYDLKIDHKKISVAQINSGEKIDKNYRFSIGSIGYSIVENMAEVKVVLKKGDEEFESIIQGPNSKNNVYRIVVQATLECIHNFIGRRDLFIVEDVEKIILAKQDVLTIGITCVLNEREELLVGSAVIKKDDYETIVKATLDAINRKVLQLMD